MSAVTLRTHLQSQGLLDRFEARAIDWAERVGVEWVLLEGELWTLASELERKKGVDAGDFPRHSRLVEAHDEKGHEPLGAIQRLLEVPGVKRASIPTAFSVEGGYALSCGGPHAKAGITALVRQQQPGWALAGYTLLNVPLALSYLMHGRSEVAKATRDLVIGTTIDVGKEATKRESAPLAVMELGSDTRIAALLTELCRHVDAKASQAQVEAAEAKGIASQAFDVAQKALTEVTRRIPRPRRSKEPTQQTKDLLYATWHKHFEGICPCCHRAEVKRNLETEHWTSRFLAEPQDLWLVCRACNNRMGQPERDGGNRRTDSDQQRFRTFQDLMNQPRMVQGRLPLAS